MLTHQSVSSGSPRSPCGPAPCVYGLHSAVLARWPQSLPCSLKPWLVLKPAVSVPLISWVVLMQADRPTGTC